MRWLILAALSVAGQAFALTENVWTNWPATNVPAYYTNLLGRELVNETWLRDRWAYGTNWWYLDTTTVVIAGAPTNIVVTNTIGDVFIRDVSGSSVTGVIPFKAIGADVVSRKMVELTSLYVIPYYEYGTSNFNTWFSKAIATNIGGVDYAQTNSNGTTNYIDRFPLGDSAKADLFHKYGLGTNTWMSNDVVILGYQTNAYGEVTNTAGWFSKRKNRPDPLIVAEWRRYNSVTSIGGTGVTNDWEFYRGWPNKFTSGDSQLFGITIDQYPVFVIHLGGTNQYTPSSLRLEQSTDEDGFGVLWYWYDHTNLIAEWISNKCFSTNADISYVSDITLNSVTQQCDNAWLALGAPLKLTGIPANSNDVVLLQYASAMNVYEGLEIWDKNLFPEQFSEHCGMFTNMYLVEHPAKYLAWTNSILTTNQYSTNGIGLLKTNMFTAYDLLGDFQTNSVTTNTFCLAIDPDDDPVHQATPWWLTNNPAPWFSVEMPSFIPAVSPDSNLTARVSPYFSYGYSVTAIVEQVFDGYANYGLTNVVPETNWTWSATRTGSVSHLEVVGESVRSQLFISDLYTGTPHCAHVYVKYNFDTATNAVPYWHWLFSTDFTTASNITTPYIDLSTNILGQLLQPVTNRTGLDCADWTIGSWSNVFVDWKTVPLNITTNYISGWQAVSSNYAPQGPSGTNDYWDGSTIQRDVYPWDGYIALTATVGSVTFSTNDFTWQLYTKRHFHDELIGGVLTPVPDSPLRTNHVWVSDCEDLVTNIFSATTNYFYLGAPGYMCTNFTYVENGTNVNQRNICTGEYRIELASTNIDTGCVDIPNPFCKWSSDFVDWYDWPNWNALVGEFDSAWDVIHRHPNESMYSPYTELYAMLYCETPLTGLYNYSTAHEHDWDKVEINTNLINTIGVKVLIEWQK